jgi:hypothetical protein
VKKVIRDRGAMKWTAMMLPEHVKLLRDWTEEDQYEQKPELDEQMIEEMNTLLCEAMEDGRELVITYYGHKRHQLLIGTIHRYDELNRKLHIIDKFGEAHYVPVDKMIDLRTG